MGVYINMEMPKSCNACMFDVYGLCLINKNIEDKDELTHSCPLFPVPPHGRLGDLDALIDKVIAKYLEHERNGELVFAAAEIKQDIVDLISDAPTIIQAEEGE